MNTALVVGHELPCPSGWMSRNVDGDILGVTSTSNSNFLACKPTASACGIIAGGGSAPRSDAPVAHSLPLPSGTWHGALQLVAIETIAKLLQLSLAQNAAGASSKDVNWYDDPTSAGGE